MLGTTPDIAFVVIKMSQYSSNPMEEHLQKTLYIVCYLSSTKDLCIQYSATGNQHGLCAYSDTGQVTLKHHVPPPVMQFS